MVVAHGAHASHHRRQWPRGLDRAARRARIRARRPFERAGLLRAVGFKFGRWVDSVLMQRALGPGDTMPPVERARS
jgi:hypothetical protein